MSIEKYLRNTILRKWENNNNSITVYPWFVEFSEGYAGLSVPTERKYEEVLKGDFHEWVREHFDEKVLTDLIQFIKELP